MGRAQLEELEKNGYYFSVPRGISMRPLLSSKRQDIVEIHKLTGEARRGDLVLYSIGEQGILHRVLRVREADYVIAGDNCWRREIVPKAEVVGIAVRFRRKGRWIEVTDRGYRLYVRVWTALFFLRRPLFYVRDLIKPRLKRLLKPEQKGGK